MARTRSFRTPAYGIEALQLFGIVSHDAAAPLNVTGTELVPLRDLAAIARPAPYERQAATSAAIAEYRRIVEEGFRSQPVVPAPFGTVFRSRSSLLHWMELHYVSLVEAVGFVGDRLMSRVRVTPHALPAEEMTDTREGRAADFETTVFDSFKFLKRSAVACVTFAPEGDSASSKRAEASFLIERDMWSAFHDAVGEEQRRLPELEIEPSEPLPPYDFVRLQFGA